LLWGGLAPAAVENRPGLSSIAYRVGTFPAFKATMLAALSAGQSPGLAGLSTRDDDDFSISLLDAWAATLDVLTFYQERIANESYLRTATERLSLLEMARLIGYKLAPGVAAGTSLAFTLETAPGAPPVVNIGVGVKAQSVPGADEKPQVFETVEAIEARTEWNVIRPLLTQPQTLTPTMGEVWLRGADTGLKAGDRLLVVAPKVGGGVVPTVRRVAAVTADHDADRTRVDLEPPPPYFGTTASAAISAAGVWALRAKAAPFGHNAPQQTKVVTSGGTSTTQYSEWALDEPAAARLTVDTVYDQIRTGSYVVIDRPVIFGFFRWCLFATVNDVRSTSPSKYGTSGRATALGLDVNWLRFPSFAWSTSAFVEPDTSLATVRETTVHVQSERLELADVPLTTTVQGGTLVVTSTAKALAKGRKVAVSGRLADGSTATEIATVASLSVTGAVTTFVLDGQLANAYVRDSVTINANVAAATAGETVAEVLGTGDASRPYQRFVLRQPPLTYVGSSDPSGGTSTLEVRVNDARWAEVTSLYQRGARDRIYVTSTDDDGRTTVQFGDGGTGARPPSGADNIRAVYRKGTGATGNLGTDRLTLLMTRPLGVSGVTNAEPATGGANPEQRDDARGNAPVTVLTLDRVVSLRDYEDFARAFAGIAKALASWTWDGTTRGVLLTVAGDGGAAVNGTSTTFAHLLDALRAAGDPYVRIAMVSYLAAHFGLSAQVTKDPDYLAAKVKAAVEEAVKQQFSFDRRDFGERVALSEVLAVIQGVPGVVGVDVNALCRTDLVGGNGLLHPLQVAAPQLGQGTTVSPAELLFLDNTRLSITVA